jgi:hypothetical protein
MREPFLGADGRYRFSVRVKFYLIIPPVPVSDSQAQFIDALRCRIAVTAAVFYSLDELADNGFGGGKVRISHAEVNNIFSRSPSLDLEGIDNGEDIGRQPLNPAKFVHLFQSFHKNNVMFKILYSFCFVKVQGLEDLRKSFSELILLT